MLVFTAHASYQKRFNKVLSFVVIGGSNDFLCISRLCCVWNVCVHVCKTSNWRFICLIICNCIYIVVINCGRNNNVALKNSYLLKLKIYTSWLDGHGEFVFIIHFRSVSQPEGILSDHPSFESIWFHLLKLNFSNNNRGPDSEWPYICRLNRNFSSYC